VLLEAWLALRRQAPTSRLIIAPHEPTPAHLGPIERWASEHRLTLARLSAVTDEPGARASEVVLVDRVGVLGDLYALADAAYVGGGFHAAGLHSVLEPAAFGAPVLFGPRHGNSRDAALLRAARGAATAATPRTMAEQLRRWATTPALRAHEGAAARHVVERGLGASDRAWALVEGLLDRTP
jgi:3-deoxy-D-manno-octulosonic-acid transferase